MTISAQALLMQLSRRGYKLDEHPTDTQVTEVASRGEFRWTWLATYLRLFVTVRTVVTVTEREVREFTEHSLVLARRRFRLRGLQAGVAVIPVLIGEHIDPAAARLAAALPVRRFAAFGWPVVIDVANGCAYYCPGGITLGGIYQDWILSQVTLITEVVGQIGCRRLETPHHLGSEAAEVNPKLLVRVALVGMGVGLALILVSLVIVFS